MGFLDLSVPQSQGQVDQVSLTGGETAPACRRERTINTRLHLVVPWRARGMRSLIALDHIWGSPQSELVELTGGDVAASSN